MARKTDIRLRRSNTEAAIPTHTNLSDGEMAMNTKDGALYFKKSDNTVITTHDDTIMHIDSSNRAVKLFETVKRDSNNTAYASGDATGFEYKEAVKIYSDDDEGVIDLSRTISNGGDREVATRIRSNGLSYFKDRLSVNTHLDFGSPVNISSYADRFIFMRGSNGNSSNADVNLIELRQSINSTTNTTSSGAIKIFTSTDGTQTNTILLSGDPDTDSLISGSLDISGDLNIAGDTVINGFTFPTTGAGTRKVLMYPGAGNRLFWGDVAVNEITYLDIALARIKGWLPGKNISTESLAAWQTGGNGNSNYLEFTTSTTADTGVVHKAIYVNAGETIHVTLPISGNANPGSTVEGLSIYAYQHHATSGDLPNAKTHVSDGATHAFVQEDDANLVIKANHQISSVQFTNAVGSATFDTAGWVSISVQATSTFASTYSKVYIKDPSITVSGATRGDIVTMSYILN